MTAPPQKIGTYEIVDTLRGGPRPVYRARSSSGAMVALKTAPVQELDEDGRQRFLREAEICSALEHPNLVRVVDSGEAGGVLFQATELLEGADLRTVLVEKRSLDWAAKLSIMEQAAEGLEYAHSMGLVHRDIKPANLFLENSGCVRVLDFGMARTAASRLTQVGMAVGTVLYMAPEQIRGEPCTAASDVFASGIVFYELATGVHPFAAGERSVPKILSAILFEMPCPLETLAPNAPAGLNIVLDRALQKDAGRRPRNAADLKRALQICTMGLNLGAPAVEPGHSASEAAVAKTVVMIRPVQKPADAPAPDSPAALAPVRPSQPAPPPPAATFCPSCTAGNPAGAAVCLRCGLPLKVAREAATEQPRRSYRTALVILVIIAAALVVALLVRR
jgi:serine/threonine-protein kinase